MGVEDIVVREAVM